MNITRENTMNDLMATIKIEISNADCEERINKVLKSYQKKAQMPGFRPGKVPFSMISKMYRSHVAVEEVNKLVSENLSQYLQDNKVRILGSPMTNLEKQQPVDLDVPGDYEFYFDIALEPTFDVVLDDSIVVNKYQINIEDEMVQKYIENTRKRLGTDIEPEVSEDFDGLTGTFTQLDENGEVLENGIVNTAFFALEDVTDEENRKNLLGLKKGDVVVFNPIKYIPNERIVANLLKVDDTIAKNMTSNFSFVVEGIKRRVLAEITEDFFEKVFPNGHIHSVAEFEDRIRQDARLSFSSETEKKFMNDSIDALVKKYEFPLPVDFMKRWILSTQQKNSNVTKEDLDANFETKYANVIRWQVLQNLIAMQYQITIEKDDVKNHLVSLFIGQSGMDEADPESAKRALVFVEEFMENAENAEQVNSVVEHLHNKKLVELFETKFKVESTPINYMDFVKILYPAPEQLAKAVEEAED